MGRRLYSLIALALAVGLGVRLALADPPALPADAPQVEPAAPARPASEGESAGAPSAKAATGASKEEEKEGTGQEEGPQGDLPPLPSPAEELPSPAPAPAPPAEKEEESGSAPGKPDKSPAPAPSTPEEELPAPAKEKENEPAPAPEEPKPSTKPTGPPAETKPADTTEAPKGPTPAAGVGDLTPVPDAPAPDDPAPPPKSRKSSALDPEVQRSQAPRVGLKGGAKELDINPLPPAAMPPGQTAVHSSAGGPEGAEPFVLGPDKIPLGKQSVGLSVEVITPQVMNLNQKGNLKIVVRNTGAADALGVVVYDNLPEQLELLASQPEAVRVDQSLLSWRLGTVPAGSERVISVRVKTIKTGLIDHAATVTMKSGAKSRTRVQEPKLKVEQSANTAKVLKGQPVEFKITISNPGDGPARNVTVRARLSGGLRHESGAPNDQNLLEQTIDLIQAGQSLPLEPLVADTLQPGEQSCEVVLLSDDVIAGAPEARNVQTITVVEPRLKLTLDGPKKRYADKIAPYTLTIENPGTAPARNVQALATLQVGGRLVSLPSGASYDKNTRRVRWTLGSIEPGGKASATFQVRMGGVGLYQVTAESKAEGGLRETASFSTDVTGLADVSFEVSERRRVIDLDDETTFQVRVVNDGTKEATNLLISATLSDNLEVLQTRGTGEHAKFNLTEHLLKFPLIDRLEKGREMVLEIKVKAVKHGIGTCRVYMMHDEMTEKIDDVARVKVTDVRRE